MGYDISLERDLDEIRELRAENGRLESQIAEARKGLLEAFEYANGHQEEWGERAVGCFRILERTLSLLGLG